MDRQAIRDKWAIVRRSKAAKIAVGLGIAWLMFKTVSIALPSMAAKGPAPKEAPAAQDGRIRSVQAEAAELRAMGVKLDEESAGRSRELRDLTESNVKLTTMLERMDNRLAELEMMDPTPATPPGPPPPEYLRIPSISRIALGPRQTGEDKKNERGSIVVPLGSYVTATLMTGVYAPTDGTTLPVFLRVEDVVVGPNRTRVPIQEAMLVGRATADENSERALITVTHLAYVDAAGEPHEVAVTGHAIDDRPESRTRGYLGIEGTYVYQMGRVYQTMVAGGIAGAADVFRASKQRVRVGPLGGQTVEFPQGDAFGAAGFGAVGAAADEFAAIMRERLKALTPAVAVPNGVTTTIAFESGFELPITPELLRALGREDEHAALDSGLFE